MKNKSSKMKIIIVFFSLFFFKNNSVAQYRASHITVVVDFVDEETANNFSNDGGIIKFRDLEFTPNSKEWETSFPSIRNNFCIWRIKTDIMKIISNDSLFGVAQILSPGDSICVRIRNGILKYSGSGSLKCHVRNEIVQATRKLKNPVPNLKTRGALIISLTEFFLLNRFYDLSIDSGLQVLDYYKRNLGSSEYNLIKFNFIYEIEKSRYNAFSAVPGLDVPKKWGVSGVKPDDLSNVWDSTMYKPWALWMRSQYDIKGINPRYFYSFSRMEVFRRLNWEISQNDTLSSKPMRVKMYFDNLIKNYQGLMLEKVLASELLDEEVLKEMGAFNPVAQRLLKDYYRRSRFLEYKNWVQLLEATHQYLNKKNATVPFFQLIDREGKLFTEKEIKGKFSVFNFWYTGCEPCKESAKKMEKIYSRFSSDNNIIIVNVSIDQDTTLWEKSIKEGIYVPKYGMHLYTGGQGADNDIIKDFNIHQFPMQRIISSNGHFVLDSDSPLATQINEQTILKLLGPNFSKMYDGPYILNTNVRHKVFSIVNDNIKEDSNTTSLFSATDQYKIRFPIKLQKSINQPKAEYSFPTRMIILSDIEGNFGAFRKLLQSNKIIDYDFNWIFGKGHVVFAGDMFDRGEQVTECLWLIYSLEEKAKVAGGMVHFILGNHEIMNLQGNHKYVADKYKLSAKLIGKTLTELYNENSELGIWLRSKNIIEKIGDILFLHGGVSSDLNKFGLSIEQINQLAKPYYDEYKKDYGDEKLNTVMSSTVGPFWFRGYYGKYKVPHPEPMIDSTLRLFNVNRIITGHTVISDTISVLYNGKVINTDTKHASGKSEALLIEGDHFYRVNGEGKRVLLFIDDKRKKTTSKTSAKK